ncbi:chaperone protein dnaJ 11, chloroplastic-like [Pistacia vera]|uniref:chaperone protein dnaJ 11, chloroplastic-like n=1 Tax=Pistacia vera TaxID=55513 RepID=UPI001263BF6E|nr:chaperone protein dnaJ 11, chloroplastic-like [Pistacia vera]
MLSSSSSSFLSSPTPILCVKPKTTVPTSPRFRFHSTVAAATTTTTAYSYTSTENTRSKTTTYRSPPHPMASCAASFYEILGIPLGASNHEIKTAYRRLARTSIPMLQELIVRIHRRTPSSDSCALTALYRILKNARSMIRTFPRTDRVTTVSGFSGYLVGTGRLTSVGRELIT